MNDIRTFVESSIPEFKKLQNQLNDPNLNQILENLESKLLPEAINDAQKCVENSVENRLPKSNISIFDCKFM